jgi:hypothetical protein
MTVSLSLPFYSGYAQTGLERVKTVEVSGPDEPVFLDYYILESSLRVFHEDSLISPDIWELTQAEGTWSLNQSLWPATESRELVFRYRTLPLTLQPVYRARELIPVDADTMAADPQEDGYLVARTITRSDLFGDSQLNRSGSLTRGISFGTNRDFSLESGLRFELSGYITEDVEVLATLTDQTTPIQPDGARKICGSSTKYTSG